MCFPRKTGKRVSPRINPPLMWMFPPLRWMTPPPSPSFDAAASTASQESHVTSPVVIVPLNQDLMAANLTVEQLQTFQHVDNVVEVQLQPCPAPPQSTTVVDTSFFERVTNMMNMFDKLVPLLTNLGSDRRSPTAGPSEIVSPNPLARVPDSAPQVPVVAPQSPDLAPRPSSASSEPHASTSGLQQRRQDEFASPRGRSNERDRSRGSRHASPSLQHHLRPRLTTSTASLSTPKRSWISIMPRVGCLQIRHGTIWRFSRIAIPSSTLPWKSRWPPPPSIAMVRRLPLMESPLLVSSTLLQCVDLLV